MRPLRLCWALLLSTLQRSCVVALTQARGALDHAKGGSLLQEEPAPENATLEVPAILTRAACDPGAAAGAEGARPYLVDNSVLQAKTRGVGFRFSKAIRDVDVDAVAAWGSQVFGQEEGDGWLRVGKCYLPMQLKGTAVLTALEGPEQELATTQEVPAQLQEQKQGQEADAGAAAGWPPSPGPLAGRRRCDLSAAPAAAGPGRRYVVDNSKLQARTKGIGYRLSKSLADVDIETVAPWGALVNGRDASDGWLAVGDCFLPVELKGTKVVIAEEETEEAKRISELKAQLVQAQAAAKQVAEELQTLASAAAANMSAAVENNTALEAARKEAKARVQDAVERAAELEQQRAAAEAELSRATERASALEAAQAAQEARLAEAGQAARSAAEEAAVLRSAAEANATAAAEARRALEEARKARDEQAEALAERTAEAVELRKAVADSNATAEEARRSLEEAQQARDAQSQALAERTAEVLELRKDAAGSVAAAEEARKALSEAMKAGAAEEANRTALEIAALREDAAAGRAAAEEAKRALEEAEEAQRARLQAAANQAASELEALRRAAEANASATAEARLALERAQQESSANAAAAAVRLNDLLGQLKTAEKEHADTKRALQDCEAQGRELSHQLTLQREELGTTNLAAAERVSELQRQSAKQEEELQQLRAAAVESAGRLQASERRSGELVAQLEEQRTKLQAAIDAAAERVQGLQAVTRNEASEAKSKQLTDQLTRAIAAKADMHNTVDAPYSDFGLVVDEEKHKLIEEVDAARRASATSAQRVQDLEWFKERATRVMVDLLARTSPFS